MPLSWVSHDFDAQNATAPFITDGPMVPLPGTLKGFSPKARGYAVCGRYPGYGWEVRHNPEGVVPGNRTGALTRRGYGVVMQINWVLCPFGRTEAPTATSPGFTTAQPFQGGFVVNHSPMVAPRRCNHGLCARIPVGIPDRDRGLLLVDC